MSDECIAVVVYYWDGTHSAFEVDRMEVAVKMAQEFVQIAEESYGLITEIACFTGRAAEELIRTDREVVH